MTDSFAGPSLQADCLVDVAIPSLIFLFILLVMALPKYGIDASHWIATSSLMTLLEVTKMAQALLRKTFRGVVFG